MTLEFIDTLDYGAQNPQTFQQLGEHFRNPAVLTLLGLALIMLITRLASGQASKAGASQDGSVTPPTVAYWIPIIGHIPNMLFDASSFTRRLRDVYPKGIFALNFGSTRHSIIYRPALVTALLNQPHSNAEADSAAKWIMTTIFGWPKTELDTYDHALAELQACYKPMLSDPGLRDMAERTAKNIRANVINLVSFNESEVDQTPWEKPSEVRITKDLKGEEVAEASLLPLIRDFCAWSANETLVGSDFLKNNPDFLADLWTMDNGFLLMATGLPRWFPIPSLTRAHLARKRNLDRLQVFHEAVEKWSKGQDPGTEWSDLDDMGAVVKARIPVYQKHNLSIQARASTENGLMWAANANINVLAFWIINHIYADRVLLAMIRDEIAPYITVEQPESSGLPISEPAQVTHFDIDGLCAKCPLLKSVYVESLRLDTATWSFKVVQQDFTLKSREKDSQAWWIRKGEYVHAAHDLHNTDPEAYENPMEFRADRHIKVDEKGIATAEMGSIRPYGGGSSMCKGRAFAVREAMMFTAAIVSMWDIERAGGGSWKIPKHKKTTGVYNTSDETRVWLKRRKISKA